jgi:predicted nucleotidyltransferase
MSTATLESIAAQVKTVCEQHHVQRLRLFGSTVRGEDRADSDVDLLVEYEPDFSPTFFSMSDLEEHLSPLFGGRPIDLIRPKDLHWFIRDSVLSSARTLYER